MGGALGLFGGILSGLGQTVGEGQRREQDRQDRDRQTLANIYLQRVDAPDATGDERKVAFESAMALHGVKPKQATALSRLLFGNLDQPVSQGATSVPTRMDIQMPAVPGTSDGGTATVDAPTSLVNKPTRYGDQTNQQLADTRAMGLFSQQQDIKARHDAENDARTKETALARAQALGENAVKVAGANNAARQSRLDDQQLFKLTQERDALYQSYVGSGLDPASAMSKANEEYIRKYTSLADAREADTNLKNVTANFIPVRAELQRRGLELREYKTDADIDIAQQKLAIGLNAQQQKQLDSETKPLWDQLKQIRAAREQVAKAKATNVYTMGTPANADAAITDMDKRANEIQGQIDAVREHYKPVTTTVPQRPQRQSNHGAAQSSSGAEDPQVRAYANQYFHGDYQSAVRAIQAQRRH
jgi:hypothetical protein